MRIFKLTIVLVITVVCFLALLHFKISFGIALFASMALMAFGINYVRKDDASETDTAYNAKQEAGMLEEESLDEGRPVKLDEIEN